VLSPPTSSSVDYWSLLKQVGLEMMLEGAEGRIWCSKIGWKTVPCSWSIVGKAALTGSSPGTRDQQSPRRRGTEQNGTEWNGTYCVCTMFLHENVGYLSFTISEYQHYSSSCTYPFHRPYFLFYVHLLWSLAVRLVDAINQFYLSQQGEWKC